MRLKMRAMQAALDEAIRQEQRVAQEVQAIILQLNQQQQQLNTLKEKCEHDQIQHRMPNVLRQAMMVKEYQAQIEYLEGSIKSQLSLIEKSTRKIALLRHALNEKKARVKSLEQLMSRYQRSLHRQEEAQEQRVIDDSMHRALFEKAEVE